jgi:hypothetical protein
MSWMVFHGRLLVTLIIIMYLCTRINEHNERNDMDKQTVTKVDQRTVPRSNPRSNVAL